MKLIRCPRCLGAGYYISYYGYSEQDPRRIMCNHAESTLRHELSALATNGLVSTPRSHTANPLRAKRRPAEHGRVMGNQQKGGAGHS